MNSLSNITAVNYKKSAGQPFKSVYNATNTTETTEGGLALYEVIIYV